MSFENPSLEPVSIEDNEKKKEDAVNERERYYDLLESLVPELQEHWEQKLNAELERHAITYAQANAALENILSERERILYHSYHPASRGSYEWMEVPLDGKELNRTIDRLLGSRLEENLLGSGAVAKVYRVEGAKNICVKVVENEVAYRAGNSVFQESQFLEDLSDFEVAGVRSPHFIQSFSGTRMNAIVMEEIAGASLEQIMNGMEELPEKFTFDDFFHRLEQYLDALHNKNIYHLDIAPRNVMIERETGLPVVIDFGKSKHFDFSEEVKLEPEKEEAAFQALRSEVRHFLDGDRKRGRPRLTKSKKNVINKSLGKAIAGRS